MSVMVEGVSSWWDVELSVHLVVEFETDEHPVMPISTLGELRYMHNPFTYRVSHSGSSHLFTLPLLYKYLSPTQIFVLLSTSSRPASLTTPSNKVTSSILPSMHPTALLFKSACRITLFTRANCGLCAQAKDVLARAGASRPFDYVEVDIVKSQPWRDLYDFDVPVVRPHRDRPQRSQGWHARQARKIQVG